MSDTAITLLVLSLCLVIGGLANSWLHDLRRTHNWTWLRAPWTYAIGVALTVGPYDGVMALLHEPWRLIEDLALFGGVGLLVFLLYGRDSSADTSLQLAEKDIQIETLTRQLTDAQRRQTA